jgi:hypothetical protein
MRKISLIAALLSAILATPAIAHEGHQMECSETAIHALHADVQAMPDGEAKTEAMKEMDAPEAMLAKKEMDGCMAHMHKAMEQIEK